MCEFFAVCDLNGSSVYSPGSNNRDRECESKQGHHSKSPLQCILHAILGCSSDYAGAGTRCIVVVVVGGSGAVRSILVLCREFLRIRADLKSGAAVSIAYADYCFEYTACQKCRSHGY